MKKARLLFKALLSLWIVYNILVLLIMPNIGSYFGRISSRFITPYASIVGLNAGWNFFSPDPAHTMYLQYTIQYKEKENEEVREPLEGYFPPEKNQAIYNPAKTRDLYAMRYMAIDPKKIRVLFAPWLCRQHPDAQSVDVQLIVETVPPLDQVVLRSKESVDELSEHLRYAHAYVECGQEDQEAL